LSFFHFAKNGRTKNLKNAVLAQKDNTANPSTALPRQTWMFETGLWIRIQ
jgi:hypothetical protein